MQAIPMLIAGVGSIVQGVAGLQAGKYNKKIGQANQRQALAEGAEEALRIRRAGRMFLGRQIAAQGESGFEVGTGSALDTLRESQTNIELEAMEAMHQGVTRGVEYARQGDMAYRQGKMQLVEGLFGAASGMAKGASDYAAAGR